MEKLAVIFKACSDETRLSILALLTWADELCVCDFEYILEQTQSKTSRHLRYLLNADLLKSRRNEKWVYYSIKEETSDDAQEVLGFLKDLFSNEKYSALKEKLEKRLREKNNGEFCKS